MRAIMSVIMYGEGTTQEKVGKGKNPYDTWVNYGDGGIYFNSHGGGWHMTDATWIRSYNNKSVYVAANLQTGGSFQVGGSDKEIQYN